MFDKRYFLVVGFIFYILSSCKKNEVAPVQPVDQLLAIYGDKQLKYSDIAILMGEMNPDRDSQQVVGNYTEKWIKEQIMIHEAKKNLKDLTKIEKLVEDFRNDMLTLTFEEQLIKEKLDTVISDGELIEFYKSNKSRYKLESIIFRFIFIKANKPIADPKNLEDIWKNQNSRSLQMLNLYCQNNADICFLNPDRWYKWEEIKQYFPSRLLSENQIHAGTNRDFADFNHAYKLKFFEVVKPNQEPPLAFLRDQATQAILHQRKIVLLDRIKADLYERELKNKRINFPGK